uniref:Ig-like domain-containing protein n=1 Tax=Panagrellus redivivus TaxID=6233 RepID=A0A7E4VLH9_PANRE
MLNIYSHSLSILFLFSYCHALKYVWVPPWRQNVSQIPDPKWHFFVQDKFQVESIIQNVTAVHPVLRGCTVSRVYEAILRKGQPRTEILTLFQQKKGEFLVNVTLNGSDIFVNNKYYLTTRWTLLDTKTDIWLEKHPERTEVWATLELQGSIEFMSPEYEWVYLKMGKEPCSEVKIKVADGYAELLIRKTHMAFPAESYDDVFILPTTTTTTILTPENKEREHDESDASSNEKEVQKASPVTALICAACAVFVLIAAVLLFFLGFRLGRWHARKQAFKNGYIKVEESVASATPNDAENKTTEAVHTPVSTKL